MILSETRKNIPSRVEFEEIKEIINKVISIGESINDISKKSSEYLNFSELNAKIQNSYNLISKLDALNIEPPSFWNTLGIGAEEKNLRNAIRENASETLANALINDFNLLIYGYDIKDINKPSPKKYQT